MPHIVTSNSPTELWHGLVREGEHRARARLDEESESYLVFTLMRHHRDAPLAHRTMALELLEALQRDGRLREQDLRDVGDRCLLIAGFYPELARRRRVPLSYFVELGQGAYRQLSEELRAALAGLYRQLARGFGELVRVLLEVRRISGDWHGLDAFAQHELALVAPAAPAANDARVLLQGDARRH